jgi:hypothetical protein
MMPIKGERKIENMNHPRPDRPRLDARMPTAIENKNQKMMTTIEYRLRDVTHRA